MTKIEIKTETTKYFTMNLTAETKKPPPSWGGGLEGAVGCVLSLSRLSPVGCDGVTLVVHLLLAVDHLGSGDDVVVHLESTQVLQNAARQLLISTTGSLRAEVHVDAADVSQGVVAQHGSRARRLNITEGL